MLWWKVFVRVFTSWTAPRLPAIVSVLGALSSARLPGAAPRVSVSPSGQDLMIGANLL